MWLVACGSFLLKTARKRYKKVVAVVLVFWDGFDHHNIMHSFIMTTDDDTADYLMNGRLSTP